SAHRSAEWLHGTLPTHTPPSSEWNGLGQGNSVRLSPRHSLGLLVAPEGREHKSVALVVRQAQPGLVALVSSTHAKPLHRADVLPAASRRSSRRSCQTLGVCAERGRV